MIYLELFWTFFKIGLFTFGGGYAMLPLVQYEVIAHQWMDPEGIMNFIAISESTPGPFAVNMSTYVGRITAGVGGSVCATIGVVLPSFIVILMVVKLYDKFKSNACVEGAMTGLGPAVIGLIAASLLSLGRETIMSSISSGFAAMLVSMIIFITAAILAFRKKHPIMIVLASAVAGIVAGYGLRL